MKKLLAAVLAVLMLCVGVFVACGSGNEGGNSQTGDNSQSGDNSQTGGQTETVDVYLPDGTPALAVAQAITEGVDIDGYSVNFHIIAAGDIGKVFAAHDDADLAIMPTIGAAGVYSNGMGIQLVSTNVFGNLFIVGVNGTAASLAELKGKVVMTTAATTIQLFQYLLEQNEIEYELGSQAVDADKVYLNSYDSGQQIIQALKAAEAKQTEAYGVLGEPQVTMCQANVPSARIAVDFQAEWKSLTEFDGYPQASLIARGSFASSHSSFVSAFADALKGNAAWLADAENIAAFKSALAAYNETADYQSTLATANLTTATIERCNLGFQSASDVKASVIDYIGRLNPSVELKDDFFFAAA